MHIRPTEPLKAETSGISPRIYDFIGLGNDLGVFHVQEVLKYLLPDLANKNAVKIELYIKNNLCVCFINYLGLIYTKKLLTAYVRLIQL